MVWNGPKNKGETSPKKSVWTKEMETKLLVVLIVLFFSSGLIEGMTLKTMPKGYLKHLKQKNMTRVNAKVVVADFGLLRRDFPFLARLPDQSIKQWLLENAALFRDSQIQLGEQEWIHSKITPKWPLKKRYGLASNITKRSVLIPLRTEDSDRVLGYLDLKGSGADHPKYTDFHGNGVLRLDEALREFYMTKIVRQISKVVVRADNFQIVDTYAVLHIPAWHSYRAHEVGAYVSEHYPPEAKRNSPSARLDLAILVRQAVPRTVSFHGYLAPPLLQSRFETLLYAFKMTSLSVFYDVLYETWFGDAVHEFLFFDVQTAGYVQHQAFIDFNLVRFLSPEELSMFKGKPVHLLQELYQNDKKHKEGCLSCEKTNPFFKNHTQCRQYLLGLEPIWRVPRGDPILPKEYDLGIKILNWTDLKYDFSPLFVPNERDEINRLQNMGLLNALQFQSDVCQKIFERLMNALIQWPQLQCSLMNNNSVIPECATDSLISTPKLRVRV